MGVYGMNRFIRTTMENNRCVKHNSLSCYKYNRIAIDYYNLLHKFLQRNPAGDEYMMEFINFIHKFAKYNIDLIFVIDGKPLEEKQFTIKQRKDNIKKIKTELVEKIASSTNPETIKKNQEKLDRISYKIKPNHIIYSKKLFDIMGVMYLHFENFEADMIIKYLSDTEIVDACYSSDMDLLTFGCKKIITDLDYKNDFIVEYNNEEILKNMGLSREEFIDLCICCGTDYNCGLINSDLNTNIKLIKKYTNIETIIEYINIINTTEEFSNNHIEIPERFDYVKVRNIYDFKLPMSDCEIIINGFKDKVVLSENDITIKIEKYIKKLMHQNKQPKYIYKMKEFAYYKYAIRI